MRKYLNKNKAEVYQNLEELLSEVGMLSQQISTNKLMEEFKNFGETGNAPDEPFKINYCGPYEPAWKVLAKIKLGEQALSHFNISCDEVDLDNH
jgi:hypothetical protein